MVLETIGQSSCYVSYAQILDCPHGHGLKNIVRYWNCYYMLLHINAGWSLYCQFPSRYRHCGSSQAGQSASKSWYPRTSICMSIGTTPDTAGREHYLLNEAPWFHMTLLASMYTLQHTLKLITILETPEIIPQKPVLGLSAYITDGWSDNGHRTIHKRKHSILRIPLVTRHLRISQITSSRPSNQHPICSTR